MTRMRSAQDQLALALAFPLLLLLGSCSKPEARQASTPAPEAPQEASGYSFDELKRLHQAHDVKTWDVVEDVDQLRFGLLRTREIFPTATISRRGTVSPLEVALLAEIGQITAETPVGPLSLDDYLLQPQVDGVIVVRQGKIVYERYPRMRSQDRHLYWSVSKSFVATVVGVLEEGGLVDVNAPIERYLDELSATDWSGTPVIDILDMASGMSGRESDVPGSYTDPETLYYQFESSLGNWSDGRFDGDDAYQFVATLKRLKPSGQVYEYTSVNSFVLSWLIEEVMDKPYAEVLSELIWQKIGAEADAGIVVDRPSGASWSGGGIFSTLRDLARYGLLFTPSWDVVTSESLVSAAHLQKIQEGGRSELLANRDKEYPDQPSYSGEYVSTYQWDRVWPDGDFFKGGFQGQGLYVSPSRDLVIAFFSSGGDSFLPYYRALAESPEFNG